MPDSFSIIIKPEIRPSDLNALAKKTQSAFNNVNVGQIGISGNKGLDGITKKANAIGSAMTGASNSVGVLGDTLSVTSRKVDKFDKGLGYISGSATEFQKSMDAATARVFAFGAAMSVMNTVRVAFDAVVSSTLNVEKRMVEINSVFGLTGKELNNFRDSIFGVSQDTAQSFDVVADGALELARQGLSAEETVKRLNAALVLSRISGLSAEQSVSSLTAAINGFVTAGLTAESITNKLVAVDTAFAVSAKDLAEGFARTGSTAEDAGVSFDELLGLITAVQQTTSRGGATIGNAFKSIFTRISRSDTITQLQELGVAIDASQSGTEKLRALAFALDALEGGDTGKASRIKELAGGVYNINVASAALKDLSSETSIFTRATQTSAGAMDEAFQKNEALNVTLDAQIQALVSGMTDLGAKIGEITLAPVIQELTTFVTDFTSFLNNALSDDYQTGFDRIIGDAFGIEQLNTVKALFESIGQFIRGPGLVLIGGAFIKIASLVGRFALDGFKQISQLAIVNSKNEQIQGGIVKLLQEDQALRIAINQEGVTQAQKANLILNAIKLQTAEYEKQKILLADITAASQRAGIKNFSPQTGFVLSKKGGRKNMAGGFSPQEGMAEIMLARALGAKGNIQPKLSKGTIGGKKFILNNQEIEIPNAGKNGDSAVIPLYAKGYKPRFRETIRRPDEITGNYVPPSRGDIPDSGEFRPRGNYRLPPKPDYVQKNFTSMAEIEQIEELKKVERAKRVIADIEAKNLKNIRDGRKFAEKIAKEQEQIDRETAARLKRVTKNAPIPMRFLSEAGSIKGLYSGGEQEARSPLIKNNFLKGKSLNPAIGIGASFISSGITGGITGSLEKSNAGKLNIKGLEESVIEIRSVISSFDQNTSKETVQEFNDKLKQTELALKRANDQQESYSREINQTASYVNTAVLALSLLPAPLAAIAGVAALALTSGNEIGKKIKDGLDESGAFDVDLSNVNTAADAFANINQSLNSVTRRSESFARTLEYLSKTVSLGGGQSLSQLGGRSSQKRLLDEIGFSGTKSQLELDKSLNSLTDALSSGIGSQLLSSRRSANLANASNNLDFASALEPVFESIQQGLNERAQKFGAKSTSDLSASSDEDIKNIYKNMLSVISNESNKGRNLPASLSLASDRQGFLAGAKIIENAFKNAQIGTPESLILAQAQAISATPQKDAILAEKKTVERLGNELKSLSEKISKGGTPEDISAALNAIEELRSRASDTDLGDGLLQSFKNAVEQGAEIQRNTAIESAKNNIEFLKNRQEIDNKFLEGLKSSLDSNINNIRELRSKSLAGGIDTKELADPFSESINNLLDKLGVSGTQKSDILRNASETGGFSDIFGASTMGLDELDKKIKEAFDPKNIQLITKRLNALKVESQSLIGQGRFAESDALKKEISSIEGILKSETVGSLSKTQQSQIDKSAAQLNIQDILAKSFGTTGLGNQGQGLSRGVKQFTDATTVADLEKARGAIGLELQRIEERLYTTNKQGDQVRRGGISQEEEGRFKEIVVLLSQFVKTGENVSTTLGQSQIEAISKILEQGTTAQAEQIAGGGNFLAQKAMNDANAALQQVGTLVTKDVAPVMTSMAEALPDFAQKMIAAGESLSREASDLAAQFTGPTREIKTALNAISKDLQSGSDSILGIAETMNKGDAALQEKMANLSKGLEDQTSILIQVLTDKSEELKNLQFLTPDQVPKQIAAPKK